MDLSDEEIVLKVQEGDSESFGILVDRYEGKISRYARKFFFNREDTQDLVQDVLIKAYENIQSFDKDRRFSPWIYRIAHNEFVNSLKRKEKTPTTFFDLDIIFPQPIAQENAMYIADQRELDDLRLEINNSLEKIDSKYREVLILFYFQDLGYKEISEILKIPPSTVGVRIKRGREQLKKFLNIKPE